MYNIYSYPSPEQRGSWFVIYIRINPNPQFQDFSFCLLNRWQHCYGSAIKVHGGVAVSVPWHCHVIAVALAWWHSHGSAMQGNFMSGRHCHGNAMIGAGIIALAMLSRLCPLPCTVHQLCLLWPSASASVRGVRAARLRTKLARLRTKLARKTGRVQAGATTTHTKIVLQTHLDTMDMMLWRNL